MLFCRAQTKTKSFLFKYLDGICNNAIYLDASMGIRVPLATCSKVSRILSCATMQSFIMGENCLNEANPVTHAERDDVIVKIVGGIM
jgi:hypothetical protein